MSSLPAIPRLAYFIGAVAIALIATVVAIVRWRRGTSTKTILFFQLLSVVPLVYVSIIYVGWLRESYIRFNRPLVTLAIAAAGTLAAWRLSRLSPRMGNLRRWLVTVLVYVSMLGAVTTLADPEFGRPLDRMTVILAVDRSRSIDMVPGADERVALEIRLAQKSMHDDDRIGLVAFGADAVTEDPPHPKSDVATPQRADIGRDGSDLEAAVRRALAELPADTASRIVVISDGVQTRGDALAAVATAVSSDVPVDVVALDQRVLPNVRIASVRGPARASEDEPIDLRIVTSSASDADVEVRLKRDGEIIKKGRAKIAKGEDVLRLREPKTEPGFHRYDVEISALDPTKDSTAEDNVGTTFVRVRGPTTALVLEGDSGKGQPMVRALEAAGFRAVEKGASAAPGDLGELATYDIVVLSDIPASDLSTSQLSAFGSYAKDLGGGLLLMGGDRSFGPGGYARTPIEDVSPVAFDLKKEQRRASLAEIIDIDYSGSMGMSVGGHTKLELANEAAARSASLLGPGDRLGVEHVDTVVSWTVPLGPVTDKKSIMKKIRAVGPGGGGIYTDISLKAGYAALDKEASNLKHLLLFADGGDAEQIAGCRKLVSDAAARGITTSVISLGRGSDTPELEVLAKVGGGRFYLIEDATKLPAVFTQETILASKGAIHETPFKVGLGSPSPATRSVDFASAPELRGYVITIPKPRATISLNGPEGDPVLATWAVGIGRASAFASDFKDRWGAGWLAWPGAGQMFGQLARDTARKADDPRVRLESDTTGGVLHLRADVTGDDGRAQTFRRFTVHVAGPDGFSRELSLEATGAGRYAASLPLSRPGTYISTVRDDVSHDPVGTTGAVLTAGEELRPTGSDRVLLERMAETSGGKTRDTLAGLFDDRGPRRFAYTPLTPAMLLASAILMIMGVGARRLGVPRFVSRAQERVREARKARTERRKLRDRMRAQQAARAQELAERSAGLTAAQAKSKSSLGTGTAAAVSKSAGAAARGGSRSRATSAGRGAASPTGPSGRALTVAERLAQKRRQKKG